MSWLCQCVDVDSVEQLGGADWGAIWKRDRKSRRAPSIYTSLKSTRLRLLLCGVPMDVASARQSPVDRRCPSEVSTRRRRPSHDRLTEECLRRV